MTNREKYKRLLKHLNITQEESAKLIARVTKRPCGARTVRSWLAEPEISSSRSCPDWAIEILESEVSRKQKR